MSGTVGGLTENLRYDIKVRLAFKSRPVELYLTLPFRYNAHVTSQPNATQAEPVTQLLVGKNIGALEVQKAPILNVLTGSYKFFGNASGDLVEKRTMIYTSDGNVIVKGGINAAGVEVGAEIANGVKVESTSNAITNYGWNLDYTANFWPNNDPLNPNVSWNATAIARGAIN
ncbi:hypothetical protein [[Flexibacter] sp. ATCC 35208]|uniref:hypothetical protein n=1 Tax=[Flexibacter] sp. ATCC 35208 TaxID=1936242 RepID=UPI0009C9E758|nr:hypothetical protein [[Flexibacter] sp. ATCC 35208]OMP75639.1 hypothetical protein BW716_29325 [[Flexibacter] sp. ATCC 35208]